MLRLGAEPHEMKQMSQENVQLIRLKLLIIMMRAFHEDCPVGRFRKEAIGSNARRLEVHVLKHHPELRDLDQREDSGRYMSTTDLFLQRVQLLILMAKSFISDCPIGPYRRASINNNLEAISELKFPTCLFGYSGIATG